MKERTKKSSDQENVEKALQLLLKLIEKHQEEIEPALWTGAMICALADNYERSEVPFKCFKEVMMSAVEHYKY